ncbi:MAG TPA: ribonuclease H-like domain-containing protein [Chloroflexota bacterium]|nr:ribonuclease H-like domain-containing protein [Chloroflexota bacterium]
MLSYTDAPARTLARTPIEALWPDSRLEGRHGAIHYREYRYAAEYRYGSELPSQLLSRFRQPPLLIAGDEAQELSFSDALFLDTETTGLSGGSGTYVFLIGAARFLNGEFVLRQFFLQDLHQERALLLALDEFAQGCTGLVSFNGKCFDVPLLASRHIMQRSRLRLPTHCHLDLLWPARRIWSRRLPSCALSALEQEVLAVERQGDIPGALIPEMYFRYLRTKEALALAPVFEHNRRDVLALAALAVALCAAAIEPVEYLKHPVDLLALGRLLLRHQNYLLAEQCHVQALTGRLPRAERGWALIGLAEIYSRTERRDEAAPLLQSAAHLGGPAGLDAAIRLAKYLEHQARDYAAAEAMTALALGQQDDNRRLRADLTHRMTRLRRKQLPASAGAVDPAMPS